MKKYYLPFLLCFILFNDVLSAQNDSLVHHLRVVDITAEKDNEKIKSATPLQIIDAQKLSDLPTIQLSDALKFLSGVIIKDYGGIGGMKTVAVRGFGAQHTSVAYDCIAVSDCQTGQIDIGKFALNNIDNISLNNGDADDIFVPARLTASASHINMTTQQTMPSNGKPVLIAMHLNGGSFGLLNPSLLIKNRLLKRKCDSLTLLSSSFYVNYLQSDGNYPYTLYYGGSSDSSSKEKRNNSDVRTLSAEANLYADFNNHSRLTFKFYYYLSQRGLPCATLFYNLNSAQRLFDENSFGQIHYENHFTSRIAYQVNAKFNYAFQRYVDPEYLNDERKLDNRYFQREYYLSNVFMYKVHKIFTLSLSNDLIYNNMNCNIQDFAKPERLSSLSVLAAHIESKHCHVSASLLHTLVINHTKEGTAGKNVQRLNPSVSISIKPDLKTNFRMRAFYKNIFRLPSFNDLYYREVGNVKLKPENTHQFDVGIMYEGRYHKQRIEFSVTADGYYNIIKDKIVAIPNKNLFVWSMLNFGKVNIAGAESNIIFKYDIIKELSIELSGNYTFQYAIDKTEKTSKTYLHQIPYTPVHSGTGIVAIKSKWLTVIYTVQAVGKRYALLQNIAENELEPYVDQSIGISRDFHIKSITLGFKAEMLNFTDKQYEIIRNYPMPGRNFRIGIKFVY